MVFESLVSGLLNKVLGDYIENLDASQLNIGIWGGDVQLNNLDVKATALDDLDLPVKLKFGYLSKLVLKIPWKNLYTEPVIATVEGLHVLVVPNLGVKYNEEKENKQNYDKKQGELAKLEEARLARRKKKTEGGEEASDGFAEKFVTQVIKNLQVTIKDIHVRYEDRYSNKGRPFAAGLTLHGLNFQTTDKDWTPCIIKEAVKLIYKLVELDSVSVYWNSGTKMISDLQNPDDIKNVMKGCIASKESKPADFNYVLQPMSMTARLRLNQKPETDGTNWTTPKVLLDVVVQQVGLNVGKFQYQDILQFLVSQERFSLSGIYRKYRPDISEYKGHYKEWWHFAYKCILEETVRRKARNWSWEHMKEHRDLVKSYKVAWIEKLTNKSPTKEHLKIIEKADHTLDIFNLNVARTEADMEVDRRGLTRVEDQQGWVGWATGWFTGGGQKEKKQDKDFASQFNEAMTPEEKSKLYEAIDYQENQPPSDYPKEFVEHKVNFQLHTFAVSVQDDLGNNKKAEVLNFVQSKVGVDLEYRTSAKGLKLDLSMQSIEAKGMAPSAGGSGPVMVQVGTVAVKDSVARPLLDLNVQTNPLDGSYDQSVKMLVQPIYVIYHAKTINRLTEVFRPPESIRLNQLTAAAMAKYEDVKTRSVSGLAMAVEQRSKLELDIKIQPTMLMIPENGVYTKHAHLLIADLGTLSVTTVDSSVGDPHLQSTGTSSTSITSSTATKDEKLLQLMDQAYDKFKVEIQSLQVLFSDPNSDWQSARKKANTPLHLLQPTGFKLMLHKATLDDLRIPKMRIFGALPDVTLSISDERLLELIKLGDSIPLPPPGPEEPEAIVELNEPDVRQRAKMRSIMEARGDSILEEDEEPKEKEKDETDANVQQIQLEASFVLNMIAINVSRVKEKKETPYLSVRVRSLGADVKMRTFDMVASAFLGNFEVEHMEFKDMETGKGSLFLLENPFKTSTDKRLLTVEFIQANKQSPLFASEYKLIEQRLIAHFEALNIGLHQEALMNLQKFAQDLQKRIESVRTPAPSPAPVSAPKASSPRRASIGSRSVASLKAVQRQVAKPPKVMADVDKSLEGRIIKTKIEADLGTIQVTIGSSKSIVSKAVVEGLVTNVSIKEKQMHVETTLKTVYIRDTAPPRKHVDILSVDGQEVFRFEFTQFNRTPEEKQKMQVDDVDMAIVLRSAQLRFVFLRAHLNRLMCWAAPFQAAAEVAASQAGTAIAESATQAAQKIQEAPPKVRLDIDLKGPAVLVPKNPSSEEALLLNLGRLSMNSGFSSIKVQDAAAISQTLELSLSELKLARVLLTDDGRGVRTECQILEPVTFTLSVERNLSFDWHKAKPELGVKGTFPIIKLSLTQEDYGMIMNTLAENISETEPSPPPVKPISTPVPALEPTTPSVDANKEKAVKQRVAVETHEPQPKKVIADKITFAVIIEGLNAKLYSGSSHLGKDRIVSRDDKAVFAGIVIDQLAAKGRITDDDSIAVTVVLVNIIMDDLRPGKTGITRLMDKKAAFQERNLVDLKFNQKANGDQIADLRVCPLFLYLCPEFLGSLANFFIVPADASASKPKITQGPSTAPSTKAETAVTTTATAPKKAKMDVYLAVEDPEIVLVEDASKSDVTQALILKLRAELTHKSGPEGDQSKGGIKGLEIFSSYFAPEKRDKNKIHVLFPCDISLVNNVVPGGGQQVTVDIDDIVLKISPSVVRLLSAVGAQMSTPPTTDSEKSSRVEDNLTKRPNYWVVNSLVESEYWFFKEVLSAEEAIEAEIDIEEPIYVTEENAQKLQMTMKSLSVRIESGFGERTVPLIFLDSALSASVDNWSSKLSANATLTLQIAYFNEMYSAWEPLIEPVETKEQIEPWKLTVTAQQQHELDAADTDVLQPAKMAIAVIATERLELTVTKSLLDVVTKLSDAFDRAAKLIEPPKSKALPGTCPYLVSNETGVPIDVVANESLQLVNGSTEQSVKFSETVQMDYFKERASSRDVGYFLKPDAATETKLNIKFPSMQTVRDIDVTRAEIRTFSLPCQGIAVGDQWHLVSQVNSEYGRKQVVLRSLLQVVNHLDIPMEMYSLVDTNLECCGKIDANGDLLNVPLPAVYSATGEFFFKPSGDEYETSAESVIWSSFQDNLITKQVLRCCATSDNTKGFYIQVCVDMEQALFENTGRKNLRSQCYKIHLRPPVVFHNMLPTPIEITAPSAPDLHLEGGEGMSLHTVHPGKSVITVKLVGKDYTTSIKMEEKPTDLTMASFTPSDPTSKKVLNLGLHSFLDDGQLDLSLYCPCWMINKTGMCLSYMPTKRIRKNRLLPGQNPRSKSAPCSKCCKRRSTSRFRRLLNICQEPDEGMLLNRAGKGFCSCCARSDPEVVQESAEDDFVVEHPAELRDVPVLFSFKGKDFFSKKKAVLKVAESEWSDGFPVDTVGSAGRVTCKDKFGQAFEVAINIQLSNSGLTKIVTFTPFYLLVNQSNCAVEVLEAEQSENLVWTKILAKECIGFWPQQKAERMLMQTRYVGTNESSQPFPFTETSESFVKINNDYVGMYYSCHVGEDSVVVVFEDFEQGMSPAFFINHSERAINYKQHDQGESESLAPNTVRHFTWNSVTTKRQLLWECGQEKNQEEALYKDGIGEFFADKNTKIYWVSFLNGRQRVLLFTDDIAVATTAHEAYELERLEQQIILSLQGIGISLVNNILGCEVAYVGITSSGIIWEQKRKRFKGMNLHDCKGIEAAYDKYNLEKEAGKKPKSIHNIDKLEVDFENMRILKPPPPRDIRRSFQTGLWIQCKMSAHQLQVHLKLNHLQVDNQLSASVFQTVFAPVPPPKSVAAESAPKPFTELSFVMRKMEHSNVAQIKYFKVLIQEMAVKADQGFINAMIALFSSEGPTVVYGPELFAKDLDKTKVELSSMAMTYVSTGLKTFYDNVHFSPFKVHLSFSQGGSTGDTSHKPAQIQSQFLNLLLKSVGVTLTEIQDVVFKLAYFEREHVFLNNQQLQAEVIDHYAKQAIKQIYVLVLGLDIIGNPYGLVRDLSSGVEDLFYEPFQGAIQGPEEFAEGLALGVRSLFGHAVGGAAGAVGRITGTLGKGLAALTMDDEYQRKRQEAMNRRPANVGEGLAQGGKGLVTGVFDGVTGVFVKPWEGAKSEGAAGFAKGVGKGLIGLVARPTSGVVDFASSSFDAVKKVTDTSLEVKRLRPPRYIHPDKIIRPYSLPDAEGNKLLIEAEKGKYAQTDCYIAHLAVTKDQKCWLFATDQRVLYLTRHDVFGSWEVDWQYTYLELLEEPSLTDKGLQFKLKEKKKKFLGLGGSSGKVVHITNQEIAKWMTEKVQGAYRKAIQ